MSSGLPLSLLSVGALALASQLPAGSFAFGHEGHWGSAGAGILLVAGNGKSRKVLVLLRSQDVTEPGFWNLAGGAVDRNEDPLEAGLRELREETGLGFAPTVARDHLLGQTVWHSPNGRFRYTTSVVEAPASVMKREIELNWENDEHRWVGADWLRDNEEELHPGFRAKMDELIAIAFGSAASSDPPRELAGSAAVRLSWIDLLSTPIASAAGARRYLGQLHAFGLDYHPDDRAATIEHKVGSEYLRLFTDEEATLADDRMGEVHQYLPDPSAVLMALLRKEERIVARVAAREGHEGAWVTVGITREKQDKHGGDYLCSRTCADVYARGGPSGVSVDPVDIVPPKTKCKMCRVTLSSGAMKGRGSRARKKTKPMMLCPRCSGSERIWVGTPNPDPRSADRESQLDRMRAFTHPGTHSGWTGCPVCANGHVTAEVHDRMVGTPKATTEGSRGMSGEASTGIVVVSVTPHRVGFAGHAVIRSLSRGKPHDPRAIHHVEVTLGSDDPALLRDDRAVHRAAQQAAAGHGVSPGHARVASGVYPANGQAGPKYRVRVDVE